MGRGAHVEAGVAHAWEALEAGTEMQQLGAEASFHKEGLMLALL